jgi:hypothetical protein
MVINPFIDWLEEVAAAPIIICPDDINAEALGNLWSFSLSQEQAEVVTPADVETFASGVIKGRRAWLEVREADPMMLYWWHDGQAGQLRFSLVSVSHEQFPFGCDIALAESIRAVATDWLRSPYLHGIPLDDSLHCLASAEESSQSSHFLLPIWTVRVP